MKADEITDVLEQIALLLELKGENPFKIRAYTSAARVLPSSGLNQQQLRDLTELQKIDGIGKSIAEKIAALAETGKLDFYDDLRDQFPPEIFELFELQGLGAKKIKALYDELDIYSIRRLERACRNGKVAQLDGFGEKTAEKLLEAIEQRKKNAGSFRIGDVASIAEKLLHDLRQHPAVTRAEIAGSYRRRKETVHDLDFLVASSKRKEVGDFFANYPDVDSVIAHGETKVSTRLTNGVQCDLRIVSNEQFPFASVYFTGSKDHNVRLRNLALQHGWSLNEYQFTTADGKKNADPIPEIHDEQDVHAALGLDYIPPELREDRGEIDAAANGDLPRLIELENLRGTFHNHTTESDGRSSLREMIDAARDLGLEYFGISDHSKSSFQANGLDEKRLAKQGEEIDKLNDELHDIRIFKGVECDILRDGSLDFSDDILASLDYVVASVHNALTLSEADMTKRIIAAISNPHVTMLGHMTGRLILTRPAYALDIPAVIEAAAETGTIIELNANPRRLDMDWRWWPTAIEKGVRCSINPDAHSTQGIQDLWFGIGAARKGWLAAKDVINTLPLAKVEKEISRKLT